ncbi:CHAT domain-containing protein, partial [bacterium]|nr:CHAT domain-containing protein [bacterium]
ATALLDAEQRDTGFGETFRSRLASRQVLGAAQRQAGDLAAAEATLDAALALVTRRTPAHLAGRLHLELARTLAAAGRNADAARHLREAAALAAQSSTRRTVDRELQRAILETGCALHVAAGARDAARHTLELAASFAGLLPADANGPQVAYFVGVERAYCLVYGQRDVALHALGAVSDLEWLCRATVAEYQAVHRPPDERAARELSTALLAPALAVWPPGATLRIVPDGLLSLLPWAALPLPADAGADGKRVVDRGPVVLVANTGGGRARHAAVRGTSPVEASLLSLGCNGSADAEGGPQLQAAEREARRVAGDWRHGRADIHTGADAAWTEALAAAMGNYGVIHVASHAVVHRGDATAAVLRLAGPEGTTPVTIDAVRSLDLRADLVYLSCCEAAGGRADAGGGAIDFAGAFLQAGAGVVVATPVRIDDRAAEAMATAFYRRWRPGEDAAAALRAAMLDLRAEPGLEHPGAWAFLRVIAAS